MNHVPATWVEAPLSSFLAEPLANGRSVPDGDGFPVLRLTALRNGTIDFSEQKSGAWSAEDAGRFLVEAGDLLVARGNGSLRLVGRARLVPRNPPIVAYPDTMIRVRPDPQAVEPRFLAIQWDAPRTRSQVERTARTTAGIYKVSQGDLRDLQFVIPPLDEQHRIVAAIETHFSRLDAAVASLTRAKANLKRARASVLKAAVEGRLVPIEAALARAEGRDYERAAVLLDRILAERKSAWAASGARGKYKEPVKPETEGLPGLPEGWCWATVEELASAKPRSIQSGPFGSSLLHSEFQATGKLVIGIDNVQDGYFSMGSENRISDAKFKDLEKYRARGRDFVITVMATIGRCCVIPASVEPAIITKHVYRVSVDSRASIPEYLVLVVRSPYGREKLLMESKGQTRPGLNGTIIKALPVPVPPLTEQHRIVAEVDRHLSVLDALDATLDANLARCANLRQSLLKCAFEGRLVQALATPSGITMPKSAAPTGSGPEQRLSRPEVS